MKQSTYIIRTILDRFAAEDILYGLIRNYEFLTDDQQEVGKDLDIVIQRKDLKRISRILRAFSFYKEDLCPSAHAGYACYLPSERKLVRFHFHLDGLRGSQVPYVPFRFLKKKLEKKYGFWAISDDDLLITLLFHTGFMSKDKHNYFDEIHRLCTEERDWNHINAVLHAVLPDKTAFSLLLLFRGRQFDKVKKKASYWKKAFHWGKMQTVLRRIGMAGRDGPYALWRWIRPAPLIVFIGMDGAGKTTATQTAVDVCKKNKVKASLVYAGRGKGNILPIQSIGRPYKRLEKRKKRLPKKFIYTVAAPFFALDMYVRYLTRIWFKRRTKQLIITDRYATDILLMSHVPLPLRKFLYFFLPKPTKTIYLYNDPAELYKRKPDHPRGDLERQEQIFGKILPILDPVQIKSVSQEQTAEDVLISVFTLLATQAP